MLGSFERRVDIGVFLYIVLGALLILPFFFLTFFYMKLNFLNIWNKENEKEKEDVLVYGLVNNNNNNKGWWAIFYGFGL